MPEFIDPKGSRTVIAPVTERDREVFAMAAMQDQLPFVFPKTKYTLTNFDGVCNGCGGCLNGPAFRGRLVLLRDDMAQLEAIGACAECGFFTRYEYLLHDDGSITGRVGSQWMRWSPQRAPKQSIGSGPARAPFDPSKDPHFSSLPLAIKLVSVFVWPAYLAWAHLKWAATRFLDGAQNGKNQ